MKIDHIAIWTERLEQMRYFYMQYFGAVSGEKYINSAKQFSSYFLSFDDGARIELMERSDVQKKIQLENQDYHGITHIAIKVGKRHDVDLLTRQLSADGYVVFSEPRTTGDGYYESVVFDPDGNKVELVA